MPLLWESPARREGRIRTPPLASTHATDSIIVAVGNDGQFARLAEAIGLGHLAADKRYATNAARVTHREALMPMLQEALALKPAEEWIAKFEASNVPCGPYTQQASNPRLTSRTWQ